MRSKFIRFISTFVVILLFAAVSLHANWGGEASGSVATGTFKPIGTAQVEMLKENLVIRLYRDRAKVEVDYVLHNTGEAVDVKAGFPSLGLEVEKEKHQEIEDYSIVVDGKQAPFVRQKGNAAPYKSLYRSDFMGMASVDSSESSLQYMLLEWLVSSVHFGRGESKHVNIRYESLYAYGDGGYSDDSDYLDDRFRYLLSTAAAWKGPIREGHVTIQAVTVNADKLTILPKGRFQKTKEGFVWEFHDLKPSMLDNIEVNLNDHLSTIFDYYDGFKEEADGRRYTAEGGRYYLDSHNYVPNDGTNREDYPASNVRDYDQKTEWRAAHSPGLGETLTLEMRPKAHITQIGIIPGCGADKAEWFSHNRVKQLEVTVNGKYTSKATVPDEYISFWPQSIKAYELIDLPAYQGDAAEISLTIRGIYPGAKDNVTCISELMLRQHLPSRPGVTGVEGRKLP